MDREALLGVIENTIVFRLRHDAALEDAGVAGLLLAHYEIRKLLTEGGRPLSRCAAAPLAQGSQEDAAAKTGPVNRQFKSETLERYRALREAGCTNTAILRVCGKALTPTQLDKLLRNERVSAGCWRAFAGALKKIEAGG